MAVAATLHKPCPRRTRTLPRGSVRMLSIWVLIVLFVTIPLALATPGEVAGEGGSTASPSPAARYGDLTQAERIQAIRGFIERGDLDTAQLLLANSRFDEGDLGYQAAFLQTIVLERRGELAEAEQLSRTILAERPEFDLVRMHLARILARQGNATGATYHLRLLAESSSDRTSRERFESFIDALDANRPFTVGGFISFAPSTNVNNGSSGTQVMLGGLPFTIDEGGRAQSGIGVRAGLNAGYSHALNEQFTLYTAGSAVFSDYSGKDFDTLVGDLRVGMRYRTASRMLSAEFIADRRWLSTTPSDYGMGGRIFGSQALMPKLIASGELLFIDRTYDDIPSAAAETVRASGRLSYYSSAAFSVFAGAGGEWEEVDGRPHNAFDGAFVEIGTTRQFAYGITASLQAKVGKRDYEADFPGMTEPRKDDYFELRSGFVKRDWQFHGFTPQLAISYYDQSSNVVFYDYDKLGFDITLTKEF
ncbi:DUF560 domain-containing protein [Georhizobium profundi]|uniref:DUF560 domain-containing protein n=2 Tax=Georhizobium profundi TaxID=2341112 RepID=A0A3S9B882_9HYPH|nr:DUF560 domain-containing protein [Georhizobium profundi]